MKRYIGLLTSGLVAMALVGAPTTAAPKQQTVEGAIALRAPFTDLASCYAGLQRRVAVVTQENVNGVVGYHFDVDKATAGKPFVLEVTGGQQNPDLDITFYTEFGTVEQATDSAYAPTNVSFEDRGPGGEAGIVPKGGFEKAIVCMFDGYGASFKYTAGSGVKAPK
jgi:hypothetical protein